MGLPLMRPRSVERALGCLRTRTVAVVQSVSLFLPLLALGCGTRPVAETSDAPLVISEPVEHRATVAVREPMVVEHPEGTLFVAGFSQAMEESGRPPKLFKSTDGGSSWQAVPVGTVTEGAVGNSDVDLAIGPDGTLYFLTMGYDRERGEGTHIAVGVSRDVGESFRWTYLSQTRYDDRPWIEVTPDGVAHVIWNDGAGVRHSVSTDGGITWTEWARITPQGGSSSLALGPKGETAVRVIPRSASGNRYDEGVDYIVVSVDGGRSWRRLAPPGTRIWASEDPDLEPLPRWVEPLAWDSEGVLYYLWSQGSELWLGRSTDQGESWESWPIVSGQEPVYFPFVVARGPGEVAATWFSASGEDLRANVALIQAGGGGPPNVRRAAPIELDVWRSTGASSYREPGGEYIPILFLEGGDLGVVTPIQNASEHRLGFAWYRISD